MNNMFGLGIMLDYQDRASAGLLNTQRIFDGTKRSANELASAVEANQAKYQKIAGIGAGLAISGALVRGVGNKILGVLGGATEQTTSFEKEMASLQFVTGATGDEFERLRKIAIDTGIETAFSPQEATQAMYELKSAGLSTDSTLQALGSTLDIVALSAGKISLQEGSTLMASALNMFNLSASQSQRVADIMAKSTQMTNFHMEDLQQFLRGMKTAPSILKAPMEELFALGGLFRNIGTTATLSGQSINSFAQRIPNMLQWAEEGGENYDFMKQLGLSKEVLVDAEGNLNSLSHIFGSMLNSFSEMTQEERMLASKKVLGARGQQIAEVLNLATESSLEYDEATRQYISTAEDGKKTFSDLETALYNVSGEAEKGADALLKTQWGIEKLWEGTKQTFQILLGETVLPIIGRFVKALTNGLNAIIKLGDRFPWIMKLMGYGVGFLGMLAVGVGTIMLFAGGLMGLYASLGLLSGKLAQTAVAQGMLSTSMLTGQGMVTAFRAKIMKFMPSLLGLATAIGLLYLSWKYDFMGIRTTLENFVSNLKLSIGQAKDILSLGTEEFILEMRKLEQTDGVFAWLTRNIVWVSTLWTGLVDSFKDNTLSMDNFLKLKELGLLPLIETILNLKAIAEEFFGGFVEGFQWIGDVVTESIGTVIDWLDKGINWFNDWVNSGGEADETVIGLQDTVSKGLDLEGWSEFGKILGGLAGVLAIVAGVKGIIGVYKGAMWLIGGLKILAGVILGPIGIAIGVIMALATVGTILYKNWDKIVPWFKNLWVKVKETAVNAWEGIKNFFTVKIPEIINGIVLWFKDLPRKIGYALGFVYGKVARWVVNMIATAKEEVPKFISAVMEYIFALPEKIGNAIGKTIETFVAWKDDMIIKAKEIIPEIIDGIIEGFGNLTTRLKEKGAEAITGFFGGMKETAKGGWEGVKGFAGGVVEGFKDGFEINSPSRLMADEIGKYIPEGIAEGIDKNNSVISKSMNVVERLIKNGIGADSLKDTMLEVGSRIKNVATSIVPTRTEQSDLLERRYAGNNVKSETTIKIEKGAVVVHLQKGDEKDARKLADELWLELKRKQQKEDTKRFRKPEPAF